MSGIFNDGGGVEARGLRNGGGWVDECSNGCNGINARSVVVCIC